MLPALTVLSAAALAVSHAGTHLPAGDALAAGRLQLALVTFALGLATLLRKRRAAGRLLGAATMAGALISGLGAAQVFLPDGTAAARADAAGFRIYQKNLLSHAWPRRPLAEAIVASGAEIVTLQEVSDHNRGFMGTLWQAYATQLVCETAHRGAIAVLSHWRAVPGSAECGSGYALMQLAPPDHAPFWVVAVHLRWPWPADQQHPQSRAMAARIAALDGPVVLSGDFNMQPWGASVRRIARAARAHLARPAFVTFTEPSPLLLLSIDHVFLPEGWTGTAEAQPLMGSDHLGLLVGVVRPGQGPGRHPRRITPPTARRSAARRRGGQAGEAICAPHPAPLRSGLPGRRAGRPSAGRPR